MDEVATEYLNSMLQDNSDPGGEAQFYDWITMDARAELAVAGEDWYENHATIVRTDGNRVEVELLRPESWVREEGIELGGELRLHHPIRSLLPSPRLRGEGAGVRSLLFELVQLTHGG